MIIPKLDMEKEISPETKSFIEEFKVTDQSRYDNLDFELKRSQPLTINETLKIIKD